MTTLEAVRQAAEQVRATGRKVSSTTVREALGNTGGKRHILKHLRALQAEQAPPGTDAPAPDPTPESAGARQSLVAAAHGAVGRLEDQQAEARVALSQATLALGQLRQRLAQALAAGHDAPVELLNAAVATTRTDLARLEELLGTLPDALVLAQDRLARAKRRQAAHEAAHWQRGQAGVTDVREKWVAGLLGGSMSRWPSEDTPQPVGAARVRLAEQLKQRFPIPVLMEETV